MNFYTDLSFWALLVTNLVVIVFALLEKQPLVSTMQAYCAQSLSIGFFWFFKIIMLKTFSTQGMEGEDGRPVMPTTSTKIQLGIFFLIHYSGFSILIFLALAGDGQPEYSFNRQALLLSAMFFAYHCFSFFYNKKWQIAGKPNIGKLFSFPYLRILPMLVIMFLADRFDPPFKTKGLLIIFMILKIIADLIMHNVENGGFQDKEKVLITNGAKQLSEVQLYDHEDDLCGD